MSSEIPQEYLLKKPKEWFFQLSREFFWNSPENSPGIFLEFLKNYSCNAPEISLEVPQEFFLEFLTNIFWKFPGTLPKLPSNFILKIFRNFFWKFLMIFFVNFPCNFIWNLTWFFLWNFSWNLAEMFLEIPKDFF